MRLISYIHIQGSGGPNPNDCNVITNNAAASGGKLTDNMRIALSHVPITGSFDVNPGSTMTYTYGSCAISVTNQINWVSILCLFLYVSVQFLISPIQVGYGGRPIAVK